jgi:hypothetical protein
VKRVEIGNDNGASVGFTFDRQCADRLAQQSDTSRLAERLHLESPTRRLDLETEIVVSLLLSPVELRFASWADLTSSIRVRVNIVEAAREAQIEFRTDDAERPAEYWSYEEGRGFVLRHNQPLIPAIEAAIRPGASGRLYSFSCWRATEYIILLAIAREAERCNADLLGRLTRQAEMRALKRDEFDRAFVQTYGSQGQPLPVRFYIPGDRTWFRNPDRDSFEVDGYEGSFTFYLGAGRFSDFWKPGNTHSLRDKCVEIHCWREATYRDAEGMLRLDDRLAESLAERTSQHPALLNRILDEMLQLQAPPGCFGGGCVEPTRDAPRSVVPPACTVDLPDAPEWPASEPDQAESEPCLAM